MKMTFPENIDNLMVIGDRVLIKPSSPSKKTKGGLLLPPGYSEKEEIQTGYVLKTGPGYPIPLAEDADEPWKVQHSDNVRYIPLQVRTGDHAIFLLKGAFEIAYHGEKLFIVPQHSILLIERHEDIE
ncbi:MAG: co-chaperone GroES family protein [Lentimicrobium sp.]|jgi:co-chaperonin GroES (HSP10)|nr:co-chaperone GroES family protein [Lentimicrobium sp.]